MPENPFVVGNPVRGRLFFGREDDIVRIAGRLKTMQSTSIVGERRIGKTSLLYYLSDLSEMGKRGFKPDEYAFLYFSFEGVTDMTPTQFWKRILRQLSQECKDKAISEEIKTIQQGGEIDPFDIEDLFSNIKAQGMKIVFLFDEFEYVTQNANFEPDFFSRLRRLTISRDAELALVTASRRELAKISHSDMLGSPFFNIFQTIFLKPFNESDAHHLIHTALAENSLSFDEKEAEFLIKLTGCHPFFFQMGCSYLYEAYTIEKLTGDEKREERLKTVKEKCMEQAKSHFEKSYWNKSSEPEKILLTTIAILSHAEEIERRFDLGNLKRCYQESESIISELEDRGLVLQKDGGYRIFSPMFADWIIGEVINRKPSEQRYEEWLKDNEGYFAGVKRLYGHAKEITDGIDPKYWSMITEWLSKSENWEKILNWFNMAKDVILPKV